MHRTSTTSLTVAATACLLAACGSSSTSSSGSSGFAAVQAAFANYGNQQSAHVKITETGPSPTSFDVDVTKDGMTGSVTVEGQQVGIVYAGGHGYVQTTPGGPFAQLPDADAKAFGLFTISTFSTCFGSFLTSRAPGIATQSVASSSTTVNGTAATDYKSPDGQAEVIVSSGSNPLPLRLTGQNSSSSSSSSSSTNPACDIGSSSSSSSSSGGGTIEIDWSYPGGATSITPPPTG